MGGRFHDSITRRCCDQLAALSKGLTISATGISAISHPGAIFPGVIGGISLILAFFAFQTLPVNQLEIALWLEADRMGFLLPAVTQEKFEVQRETVKNERGQRVFFVDGKLVSLRN